VQVLEDFNATAVAYAQDRLVHELFEAQARRTPDAVAVRTAEASWSYAQLDRVANQWAHCLRDRVKVQPDSRIALIGARSAQMVIGMLAVLKAGGAYVPLDPEQPPERLAFQLRDSGASAVLVEESLASVVSDWMAPDRVLSWEEDIDAWPTYAPDLGALELTSHALAYVMYTSGSTGQPKGVMVEHRNVLRLVVNNHFAPLGPEDCVAHCANPAFDASTWEVWGALLNGASLTVIDQKTLLDPNALEQTLDACKINVLHLTVGLFHQYADLLAHRLGKLRYLLFGGEQSNPEVVAKVFRNSAPQHLIHCYGPTETTTFASTLEVLETHLDGRLPVGRPIANTHIYVLDETGAPAPLEAPGEIYIGGAGVARGYLNQPELTAKRFVRDPFCAEANARMYRTGDLGRWRADGTLEYLGRNDFQVKLRGFRIEPGEIEALLTRCAGVRDAVVVVQGEGAARHLVAYLVSDEAHPTDIDAMRANLRRQLPEYMIPSSYVLLHSLPLTPNGKLDRKALPAPESEQVSIRRYQRPESEVEQGLAALWALLLDVERIGRYDHFFDLGGNSLLTLRAIPPIREQFGVAVTVADLFKFPLLADLAEHILALQMSMLAGDEFEALQKEINALSKDELLSLLDESAAHD
jgi:amino acid adenylation domain-containing protein